MFKISFINRFYEVENGYLPYINSNKIIPIEKESDLSVNSVQFKLKTYGEP